LKITEIAGGEQESKNGYIVFGLIVFNDDITVRLNGFPGLNRPAAVPRLDKELLREENSPTRYILLSYKL
jgi:hypothetical protein